MTPNYDTSRKSYSSYNRSMPTGRSYRYSKVLNLRGDGDNAEPTLGDIRIYFGYQLLDALGTWSMEEMYPDVVQYAWKADRACRW